MLVFILIICIVLQIVCIIEVERKLNDVEKALNEYSVIYYETRELHQKMKKMLSNKQEAKNNL